MARTEQWRALAKLSPDKHWLCKSDCPFFFAVTNHITCVQAALNDYVHKKGLCVN